MYEGQRAISFSMPLSEADARRLREARSPDDRKQVVRDLTMPVHDICTSFRGEYFYFEEAEKNERGIKYHIEGFSGLSVETLVDPDRISTAICIDSPPEGRLCTLLDHPLFDSIAKFYGFVTERKFV